MLFDDRLDTVLRMRADSAGTRRIQMRQLVDLLGTLSSDVRNSQVDAAYTRLSELQALIPAPEAAQMLGDPALRLRSPRLVAALCSSDPRIAAMALGRAELDEEQWLDLIPALGPSARQALFERRDLPPAIAALVARLGVRGRGLPPSTDAASQAPSPGEADIEILPPSDDNTRGEEIGAIVRRIEAYRRARQVVEPGLADSPRLPLGEDHVIDVHGPVKACDFATDAEGRISWCDPGVAPMLVGQRLDEAPEAARLVKLHQPLRAMRIEFDGAPAIAGHWQVDAAPWFDPVGGRFLGYRGRLRRPPEAANPPPPSLMPDTEADRIRQMLHELRTPINAIQVGAEIIQQQLYGTTPHEYRALAAGIVGDAARMLSAFDELERLAKLSSGALDLDPGASDLAATVRATAGQLDAHTKSRGSGFDLRIEVEHAPVALAGIEVERLVWRLLATVAGTSAPGEQLKLRLRLKHGMFRLDAALPAAIARFEGEDIFKAAAGTVPQVIAAGVFGTGFALRLARAEARAAGGELQRKGDRLRLTLPGLTLARPGHTQAPDGDGAATG